jgi:hypothetical protein
VLVEPNEPVAFVWRRDGARGWVEARVRGLDAEIDMPEIGAQRAIRGFASARPGRSPCDLREPTGVPNRREACREVDGRKAFHFRFAGSIQGRRRLRQSRLTEVTASPWLGVKDTRADPRKDVV